MNWVAAAAFRLRSLSDTDQNRHIASLCRAGGTLKIASGRRLTSERPEIGNEKPGKRQQQQQQRHAGRGSLPVAAA
jgi:hypothetical protein